MENPPQLQRRQLILVTIVLCIASLLFVLDYSISSIILPYVTGDLGVRYEQGAYIVTTFSVGNALAIPPLFFLNRCFGERRLLFYTLMTFPVASLFCGLTDSFEVLLFFRFILGLISGPIMPLTLFLLLDLYPKRLHETVFGIWACSVITAPMIGPIIGGYLCTEYSWRAAFLISIPIGVICGLILHYEVGLEKVREKHPFDWIGYCALALFSICVQLVMDKGQQWDWYRSELALALGVIAIFALAFFIAWNLQNENPIIDFSLLKFPGFSLAIIILVLTYGSFFGSIILIPVWLETMMGYDAFKAGLALAPIGILPAFIAPFNATLVKRFGLRPTLFVSMGVFATVSYYTTNFYIDVDLFHIQLSHFFLGLGFALYLAPLLGLGLEGIPEERHPQALVFFHYIRITAGALGAGGFSMLVTRRTQWHHEFLGEFVNVLNPYLGQYFTAVRQLPMSPGTPQAILGQAIEMQAKILALLDAFGLMACLYLVAMLAILLNGLYIRYRQWQVLKEAVVH